MLGACLAILTVSGLHDARQQRRWVILGYFMAYATYTTDAIICGTYSRAEHDSNLLLYTKDAGMVYARAPGVRALQSKLRYALQDFSYSQITMVHGRHEWRVTGAICIENLYYGSASRAGRVSLLSSVRSLKRLMQGGGVQDELFSLVLDGLRTLSYTDYAGRGDQLFLLRLLHHLGYIAPADSYEAVLHAPTLVDACDPALHSANLNKVVAEAIERALVISHL